VPDAFVLLPLECVSGWLRCSAQPGAAGDNHRPPFGRGRHDEQGATDGHQGPAKADAFVLLRPQAAKGRTHEDPPRPSAGRRAPRPPVSRYAAWCSSPRKVERVGPWGRTGPKTWRQRRPAQRPGRPRNHPPHPAPGPDRATANRPPKPGGPHAPDGVGRLIYRNGYRKRPTPLVRRELDPLPPAGVPRPPASSGCSAAVDRGPSPSQPVRTTPSTRKKVERMEAAAPKITGLPAA
jgi:hypothetical protein